MIIIINKLIDIINIKYKENNNIKDITNKILIIIRKNRRFIFNNKLIKYPIKSNGVLLIETKKKTYTIKYNENIIIEYNVKKVITNENINLLKDLFSQYNEICIFGKGPSFINIEKTNEKKLYIGINQTANILSSCDMLAINDVHNLDPINIEVIKKLKFIIIPEYLHIDWHFNLGGHWHNIYHKINEHFNGYYIIFNLCTTQIPNKNIITINSGLSTANTCNDFICTILKKYIKIDIINFYGIGITSEKNYHNLFEGRGKYTKRRILGMKLNLENICKKNNIKYKIN